MESRNSLVVQEIFVTNFVSCDRDSERKQKKEEKKQKDENVFIDNKPGPNFCYCCTLQGAIKNIPARTCMYTEEGIFKKIRTKHEKKYKK